MYFVASTQRSEPKSIPAAASTPCGPNTVPPTPKKNEPVYQELSIGKETTPFSSIVPMFWISSSVNTSLLYHMNHVLGAVGKP